MSDDQDRREMTMVVSPFSPPPPPQRHTERASNAKLGQTRNPGSFRGP